MDKPHITFRLSMEQLKLHALRFQISLAKIELDLLRVRAHVLARKHNLILIRDAVAIVACVFVIMMALIVAFNNTLNH